MSGYDYRPFLPPPGTSKIAGPTPREHTQARTKNNPRAQGMFANWERMLNGPFRGITTECQVIPQLFTPRPEGAPTLAHYREAGVPAEALRAYLEGLGEPAHDVHLDEPRIRRLAIDAIEAL